MNRFKQLTLGAALALSATPALAMKTANFEIYWDFQNVLGKKVVVYNIPQPAGTTRWVRWKWLDDAHENARVMINGYCPLSGALAFSEVFHKNSAGSHSEPFYMQPQGGSMTLEVKCVVRGTVPENCGGRFIVYAE
jgi:hypothetical protein